ncbi:nucleolar DEAD-box protein required for synthesis of 60S ribosomal subunit [Zygosaccharomyces mellis]|uniref:ATP-dependent RNA helicase DRS1 n=1 Tax=Zygosaccharomyces mellis TaxID=42258 RepID=A0A4C2EET0_9SACH|nr:nucleolar DEAD-box protein required for synthesis of 60S ribosomal subunit [Zygosaccharomyces mellis]
MVNAVAKKGRLDLDFVPTISDSEDALPDLESSDEEENRISDMPTKSQTPVKKSKNNKKKNDVADVEDENVNEDLNPEFKLDLESNDIVSDLQEWNFIGDEPNGENERKDVDLDSIIRRKGGLIKTVRVDDKGTKEESEKTENADVENSEDDDELAMDGFGMGAVNKDDDEEEGEEEEDENDSGSESEKDNSEGKEDDHVVQENQNQEEEDSPEEMAKFYAPQSESDEAKKKVFSNFNSLSLSRPVLKALGDLGYATPSPIQGATIPIALLGKDIIAGAVTGSGKTAAYMIPIIERLIYKPAKVASTRVVVLAPTRELAIQVADMGRKLGKYINGLTFGLAVGGLNLRQQEQILKTRPDIVIATPGRFIDHVRNSSSFNVDSVEVLVIDEADRMLEEGFQDELNEIMHLLPSKRQTMLFSATMNSKIKQLVSLSLKRPVRVMTDPPKQAASKLQQEFVRIRKRDHLKPSTLFYLIKKLDGAAQKRMVVFVSKKEVVHRLRIILGLLGMAAAELHGSLNQEQRLQAINRFKSLEVSVLICTDLASRGLDIPKIEVVINYDMPKSYEIYLHRIGRTARAGREGRSVSFVGETSQERSIVKSAIKSAQESSEKNLPVGRNVDWNHIEELNKTVESMSDTIKDILDEEKQEKEILQAEMQLKKGENLIKHKQEIESRPKRTWFQTEAEKKDSKLSGSLPKKPTLNSKKRKRQEALENKPRLFKKTQKNRSEDQERSFRRQNGKRMNGKKGKE